MQEEGQTRYRDVSSPPKPGSLKGAFQLRIARYPWAKATAAALTMGICVTLGASIGHTNWGLLASVGGFASLYVHNEPYAKRAVKLVWAALGLAASLGLGTLGAGHAWTMALVLGLVSMAATFVSGAFRLPPPGGYFFILSCALGTGLPVDVFAASQRFGLALAGGVVAWVVCMMGWTIYPHKPEERAVSLAFREVAAFLNTDHHMDAAQRSAAMALQASESAVSSARFVTWRRPGVSYRLYQLHQVVKELFADGVAINAERRGPIRPELSDAVQILGTSIGDPSATKGMAVPRPLKDTPARQSAYRHLLDGVRVASTDPFDIVRESNYQREWTAKSVLRAALRRESLVLPAVFRMGVAVVGATIIAHLLGDARPYWVPLTCASILQGPNAITAVHRTVQRALGTAIGVCVAVWILASHLPIFAMVTCLMLFQFLVELVIVRNYGLAVIFITPLPLILAEAGFPNVQPLAIGEARLFDTLIGCLLGLMAVLWLWRRSSSKGLRRLTSAAVQSLLDVLTTMSVLSGNRDERAKARDNGKVENAVSQVQTAILNLRMGYDAATNEMHQASRVETFWPAVVSLERLGYAVMAVQRTWRVVEERTNQPSSETSNGSAETASKASSEVALLRDAFAELTLSIERGTPYVGPIPHLRSYPGITSDFELLVESLNGAGGQLS